MRLFTLLMRQLRHNRMMTSINIAGLTIAMTVVLLIAAFVGHELSYERSIPKAKNIYLAGSVARIGGDQQLNFPMISAPMAVDLKNEVAGITEFCRIRGSGDSDEESVSVDQVAHSETGVFWADSTFFTMTGLPLIQGNPTEVLNRANTVVLTRSTAQKFFGDEDPVGREILYRDQMSFTVTGVMEDIGAPSIISHCSMIFSWVTMAGDRDQRPWLSNVNWLGFFELTEGSQIEDVMPAINECADRHTGEFIRQIGGEFHLTMTALLDVHLYGDFNGEIGIPAGRYPVVAQFALIGIVTLLIALLNYINMTTAQSTRRGMLVGVSKTMGAPRSALVRQFLAESIVTAVIAAAIALLLAVLLLPSFGNLVTVELSSSTLLAPMNLLGLAGLAIVVGLLAGWYPAMVISSLKPSQVLRRELATGRKGTRLRSALVVVQFAVAVVLITSSLVVLRQMNYMRTKDLGFNREQVLAVNLGSWEIMQNYRALYDEYRKLPFVISSATADDTPLSTSNNSVYHIPGTALDAQVFIASQAVDHDYIDAMQITLLEGRNFDRDRPTDSTDAVIINETAARYLGYDEPVGMQIDNYENLDPIEFSQIEIIGVMKDMHFEALRTEVRPFFLHIYRGFPPWLLFRLQPGTEQLAISTLKEMWPEFAPEVALQYHFLDDSYDAMYREEERLSTMFNAFTLVAIFVAALGLFALATFAAERRTKEIGIRKVLGASSPEIIRLLVIEFITLVGISNLIALPLGWYLMNNWLQGYAYRTEMSWWIFGVTAVLSVVIALLTVSSQALRASLTNPVKALRYE